MNDRVVLVDEMDRPVGVGDVAAVHVAPGILHRAFSAFLFNDRGELLLQRRSVEKRHFRRKWSNSCCGHSRPGEPLLVTAKRRLAEELGVSATLRPVAGFVYTAVDVATGLVEREYDWVLVGGLDGDPDLNPHEADAFAWADPADVGASVARCPDDYTPWLPLALRQLTDRSEPARGRSALS